MKIRTRIDAQGHLYLCVGYMGAEDEVGPVTSGEFEAVATLDVQPVVGKTTNPKKLRRKAMKVEDKLAEDIGGRRHKGSGSLSYLKGDVRLRGRVRAESKFTQSGSYRVNLADLWKIASECAPGEVPAFDVTFVEPRTLKERDSWVLIPRSEWQRLLEVDGAASDH